jgi:hypothetical protein
MRSNGYTMLMIGLPLLAFALWNCLKAMRRISEIQLSPVWKHLVVYGNAEQLSQQIEAELQPAMVRKYGKLQIAQQWMVRRKTFSTWVLVGRHRQRIEEQMKEKAVNEMLADLTTRVPWVLFWFYQGPGKSLARRPCRRDRGSGFPLPAANNRSAAAGAPSQ